MLTHRQKPVLCFIHFAFSSFLLRKTSDIRGDSSFSSRNRPTLIFFSFHLYVYRGF